MPDSDPDQPEPSWLRRALDEHLALTISGALIMLSVLHIVFVAAFEPQTVLALLSVADRTQIVVSTLSIAAITAGSGMLLGVMLPNLGRLRRVVRLPFHRQLFLVLLVSVLAIGAVLQLPYWSVGALAVTAVVSSIIKRRRANRLRASEESPTADSDPVWEQRLSLAFAFMFVAILIGLLFQPWVPSENVELGDDTTVVAFVIGSQDSFTMLLIDREVRWVETDQIKSREMCEYSGAGSWLSARFRLGVDYADCAD